MIRLERVNAVGTVEKMIKQPVSDFWQFYVRNGGETNAIISFTYRLVL